MGAATDRRDQHRPLEYRPAPDDQTQLAPAARGEHCGFPISCEGISSSRRTTSGQSLKRSPAAKLASPRMRRFVVMLPKQVLAEIVFQVAPHSMNVIRIVLSVVVFH